MPFPSEPTLSYSCLFDLSDPCWPFKLNLSPPLGSLQLMLPRAMPKSMAWSPFPGGTLFMCLLSFLMPVPFPACTCTEVWRVCWVGREERAHKAGAGELRACLTSWLQCECGGVVHLPSCYHPTAPRAARRHSLGRGSGSQGAGGRAGPTVPARGLFPKALRQSVPTPYPAPVTDHGSQPQPLLQPGLLQPSTQVQELDPEDTLLLPHLPWSPLTSYFNPAPSLDTGLVTR